jgi:hypothetical protein
MRVIQTAIEKEEHGEEHYDPDTEAAELPERPFLLYHASTIGFAMALVVVVEMLCVSIVSPIAEYVKLLINNTIQLLREYRLDGKFIRFALVRGFCWGLLITKHLKVHSTSMSNKLTSEI